LHREAGLRRIVVDTYQATSGAGGEGVDELDEQQRKVSDRASALTFDVTLTRSAPIDELARMRACASTMRSVESAPARCTSVMCAA